MKEGFDEHFQDHFEDIWRFAHRRTSSSADADDIAAETFAVAWRRRHDWPNDGVRPWLFGVARNVLLNHSRTVQRQSRLRIRLAQSTSSPVQSDPAELDDGSLWRALSALSTEDRELLIMRAWDGLAVTEMAVIFGCTANAVSLRLHKARNRLAAELGWKDEGDAGQVGVRRATNRERP